MSQESQSVIAAGVLKHLNSHGHGFQQAVLRRFMELGQQRMSPWRVQFAEYPLHFRDRPLALDALLYSQQWNHHRHLVLECKRVDPALGRWCFVRLPGNGPWDSVPMPIFSGVISAEAEQRVYERTLSMAGATYQLGFELKTNRKGDGGGHTHSALDAAHAQVLKGTAALLEQFAVEPHLLPARGAVVSIMPAIVTSAELFVTDDDISTADLLTGDLTAVEVKSVPWLWFQTHVSRDLRPGSQVLQQFRGEEPKDMRGVVRHRHTRAVAVVSSAGLGEFAQASTHWEPDW